MFWASKIILGVEITRVCETGESIFYEKNKNQQGEESLSLYWKTTSWGRIRLCYFAHSWSTELLQSLMSFLQ